MKKAYDRIHANQLLPLLESISREITERGRRIQELELQAAALTDTREERFFDAQAELATHKREVRLAERELDQLGCVVDDREPTSIIIPGTDGKLTRGFRWEMGRSTVRRLASDTGVPGVQ